MFKIHVNKQTNFENKKSTTTVNLKYIIIISTKQILKITWTSSILSTFLLYIICPSANYPNIMIPYNIL